jgi:hypothetical protein
MMISEDGKVGIGTTSPTHKLHVSGQAKIEDLREGDINMGVVVADDGGVLHQIGSRMLCLWKDEGSYIFAKNAPDVIITDELDPLDVGKIGIGTTDPQKWLHIKVGGNDPGIRIENTQSPLGTTWDLVSGLWTYVGAQTDNFGIVNVETNKVVMSIDPSGNVGIGGIDPQAKLEIDSDDPTNPSGLRFVDMFSNNPDAWTLTVDSMGNVILKPDDGHSKSSRRWKENIRPIEGALEKVLKLRGVYFRWKETGKEDIGMIAEEVGEVVPEVVTYEENGVDAKALDYARLVSLLVEAVKEQQKEIEKLKALLDELQKRK